MNWLKILSLIQKRPSDKTIITTRIVFWLILITVLYYNFFLQTAPAKDEIEKTILFGNVETSAISDYIKYWIVALWIFPLVYGILGIFKIPLFHKKFIRIGQVLLGIWLWYSACIVVNQASIDINELLILAWFLPFFAWLTWKMIVSSAIKYGEKIKKIRV